MGRRLSNEWDHRSFKAVPPSNRCNEFWVGPSWAGDFVWFRCTGWQATWSSKGAAHCMPSVEAPKSDQNCSQSWAVAEKCPAFHMAKEPWHHPRDTLSISLPSALGPVLRKQVKSNRFQPLCLCMFPVPLPFCFAMRGSFGTEKHTDQNQEMCTSKTVECCQVIIPKTWGACDSAKMPDDFPVQVDKRTETLESKRITVTTAWVARPCSTPEDREKIGGIMGKNVPSCIVSVPTGVRGRKTLVLSLQLFDFRGGFQEHQNMWRNKLKGLGFGQSDCGCRHWPVHHVFLSWKGILDIYFSWMQHIHQATFIQFHFEEGRFVSTQSTTLDTISTFWCLGLEKNRSVTRERCWEHTKEDQPAFCAWG